MRYYLVKYKEANKENTIKVVGASEADAQIAAKRNIHPGIKIIEVLPAMKNGYPDYAKMSHQKNHTLNTISMYVWQLSCMKCQFTELDEANEMYNHIMFTVFEEWNKKK